MSINQKRKTRDKLIRRFLFLTIFLGPSSIFQQNFLQINLGSLFSVFRLEIRSSKGHIPDFSQTAFRGLEIRLGGPRVSIDSFLESSGLDLCSREVIDYNL